MGLMILLLASCAEPVVDHGEPYIPALRLGSQIECVDDVPITLHVIADTDGPIVEVVFHVALPDAEPQIFPLVNTHPRGDWELDWVGPESWRVCTDAYVATYTIFGYSDDGRELDGQVWIDTDPAGFQNP